jgi:ubiquinone/menaquinone biosynthesis C-methylase UbiE
MSDSTTQAAAKPASAPAYDAFMGRWSRIVAARFVEWLALPPRQRWLDVGCGTGALAGAILKSAAPAEVWGVDPTEAYIARARMMHTDGRCRFLVGDAQALPAELSGFDAIVSGLMINLVPDPARAMAEMCRVTRAGGIVATYVWDFAEGMQVFRCLWDAARELDPAAEKMDQGVLYTLCRPEPLRNLLAQGGLGGIEVEPLDIPTVFADFDDYWSPFLSGQGTAPGYVMSLSEELRRRLRDRIRAAMPLRADGSIHLNARAWLVRGTNVNAGR